MVIAETASSWCAIRYAARPEGRDIAESAPGLLVSGLCFAEEKIAGHDSTSDVSIR
jgi:hypothetical protein